MLVTGNEIDRFGDDGIDYGASNILITKNYIHDPMEWNIGAHMDGMQGYSGTPVPPAKTVTFKNVVIDSNKVIRQADPKLPFPTNLQGIDAFDGDWANLSVTNNVVLTSSCWGLVFSSVHGGKIVNNTVVDDGLRHWHEKPSRKYHVSPPACRRRQEPSGLAIQRRDHPQQYRQRPQHL